MQAQQISELKVDLREEREKLVSTKYLHTTTELSFIEEFEAKN